MSFPKSWLETIVSPYRSQGPIMYHNEGYEPFPRGTAYLSAQLSHCLPQKALLCQEQLAA